MPDALPSCVSVLRDCQTALESAQSEGWTSGFIMGVGTVIVVLVVVVMIGVWQQRKGSE